MGKKADAPKETALERALAQVAVQKMAQFRQKWLPLQRQFGADVMQMGRAGSSERRRAAGVASTESAVQFGEAQQGLQGALREAGAAPSSSRFKLATTGLDADQATSRGMGFAAADAEIDDAYVQGLAKLTGMARGQSTGAIKNLGDAAGLSAARAASDAQLAAAHRAGNAQLVGQAAGIGLAAGLGGGGGSGAPAPAVGMDWPTMDPKAPAWGGGMP